MKNLFILILLNLSYVPIQSLCSVSQVHCHFLAWNYLSQAILCFSNWLPIPSWKSCLHLPRLSACPLLILPAEGRWQVRELSECNWLNPTSTIFWLYNLEQISKDF